MAWIYLGIAGLLEVVFATCLKQAHGFTRWGWVAGFVVTAVASLFCLNRAMQTIPLGTAYAVWTGIGAFGVAIIGIIFFKDPVTFGRIFFLCLIIGSALGLRFVSGP